MKFYLNTEIGLMGIWDVHSLDFIVSRATYNEFIDNLVKVINDKKVVIWGVGGDGERLIDFRLNSEALLTSDEKSHVEMESSEYKLKVSSGEVVVGSPEWAGGLQNEGLAEENGGIKSFNLENGDYKVKIYFDFWDPENSDNNDKPEFIVFVTKLSSSDNFSPISNLESLA